MWNEVLGHRPEDERVVVVGRLAACGLTPEAVAHHLADFGDTLYAAARDGAPGWTEPLGGPVAVALLAAEVSALAAHVNSRASAVRGTVVDSLLEDVSAIAVANHLGVSRQQVYKVARHTIERPYLDRAPGRRA